MNDGRFDLANFHGAYVDNDGTAPGDNLYGAPDSGFTSPYHKRTERQSIGDGGWGFLYLMSVLIGAPLLSAVPIVWPICMAIFWLGVAAFVVCGLLENTKRGTLIGTWLAFTFAGCAALFPILWVASVARAMSGR